MTNITDVAIIGAGPYGLSLAAHLAQSGVEHRILGQPMQGWSESMPVGMLLKSDGFASNLSDPADIFTLKHFCAQQGIEYADLGLPVSRETFIAYGRAFQQRLVPHLEQRHVRSLDRRGDMFQLSCGDGETIVARRVVVAVGVIPFAHVPHVFANLPADRRSHSAEVAEPRRLAGRKVVVVGAGASAIDLAALLHEAGAKVTLAARRRTLDIHAKMRLPRPWLDRLRAPGSGIGPSWRSRLYCEFPHLFRLLPVERRLRIVQNHLGPAAGWFMRERVEGQFPVLLGATPVAAEVANTELRLSFRAPEGLQTLTTEHVVAATGYRIDLARLTFLPESLRRTITTVEGAPELSSRFESSLAGLFFIGPPSANSFGPVMRFAFGAGYTAHRLSAHLRRQASTRRSHYVGPAPAQGTEPAKAGP